jgi:hypothetical protein
MNESNILKVEYELNETYPMVTSTHRNYAEYGDEKKTIN